MLIFSSWHQQQEDTFLNLLDAAFLPLLPAIFQNVVLYAVQYPFTLGFLMCLLCYTATNAILQLIFYYWKKDDYRQWKSQPDAVMMPEGVGLEVISEEEKSQLLNRGGDKWENYWMQPLYREWRRRMEGKPPRAPHYAFYTTLNIIIASCMAGIMIQLIVLPNPFVTLKFSLSPSVWSVMMHFLALFVYENVVEYWWHRLMHLPYFYRTAHKIHHHFKSPMPYDDLYVHPLEVTGYYFILFGPVVFMPVHFYAFVLYLSYLSFTGCADHSGVKISIPHIYSSYEHDKHHELYEVNYGFPHLFMDHLCGTYHHEENVKKLE